MRLGLVRGWSAKRISAAWSSPNHRLFHGLPAGTARLTFRDGAPVSLAAGDLVRLAHGDGHVIADHATSPVLPLDAILAGHPLDEAGRLSYGGDGSRTRLLAGGFELCPPLPDDLADFSSAARRVSTGASC
jgi:hypothetical protein